MTTLPSLRQLRYLVAVSERLNFTQAAQDCFVTQSTLSAGLKELERTLGANLVERDRQRVMMTGLGREVVTRARALLSAAEDLAERAAAQAAPMTGLLRLGAIPTLAPFLLPQVLPQLRKRYPQLKLLLREDQTGPLLERLRVGQLDFGLIALPFETGDLLVRRLFWEELWLVTPPGEKVAPLRACDLPPERLLLLEEGHCLRQHTLAACSVQQRAPDALEASSLYTLIQMVEGGWGLALLPETALRAGVLDRSNLIARPLLSPAPSREIALVARPSTAHLVDFELLAQSISEGVQRSQGLPSVPRRGPRRRRR